MMATPYFYVIARNHVARGSFARWSEILVELCKASLAEARGVTYYWSQDDNDDDTLWALEGFTHPIGFFRGHVSTKTFIEQNRIIEREKLLPNGYNLYHYDLAGGWLTRDDDAYKDSKSSHVVVHHFWSQEGKRDRLIQSLTRMIEPTKMLQSSMIQSFLVLRECDDNTMATLWVRTKTRGDFRLYQSSDLYRDGMFEKLKPGGEIVDRGEVWHSRAFIGHIDQVKSS